MRQLIPVTLLVLLSTACSTVSQTRDIKVGMSQEEVEDEIGSPSEVRANGNVSVHEHRLYTVSKPMQVVLAPYTFGLIFLANKKYWFTYKDGKLDRFGEPESFQMDDADKSIIEVRNR